MYKVCSCGKKSDKPIHLISFYSSSPFNIYHLTLILSTHFFTSFNFVSSITSSTSFSRSFSGVSLFITINYFFLRILSSRKSKLSLLLLQFSLNIVYFCPRDSMESTTTSSYLYRVSLVKAECPTL